MRELVARHPHRSALIAWVALLVITQGLGPAVTDVRERTWPVYVLIGFVIYSAFAVWFTARKMRLMDQPVFEVLLALSAAPTIIGTGLAFQGAPMWSLWATLFACGGLLLLSLQLSNTAPHPRGIAGAFADVGAWGSELSTGTVVRPEQRRRDLPLEASPTLDLT